MVPKGLNCPYWICLKAGAERSLLTILDEWILIIRVKLKKIELALSIHLIVKLLMCD
jgi:hypothetical protein